jgi:hypothetical protein
LPSADFHFEFYVDRAPSGEQRTIPYTLEVPYNIEELTVTAQQPARAAGFTLAPAAENTEQGPDGLTYHSEPQRAVRAKLIGAQLFKTDGLTAQLGYDNVPVQGYAILRHAQAGSPEWLPWLLIGGYGAVGRSRPTDSLALPQDESAASDERPAAPRHAIDLLPGTPRQYTHCRNGSRCAGKIDSAPSVAPRCWQMAITSHPQTMCGVN